ncbi:MAG: hypothetical protein R2941_17825 [Desulfobacterales bacterium]
MSRFIQKIIAGKNITCETLHQRLADYISDLNLNEYIYPHASSDVIVLADSGFDGQKNTEGRAEKVASSAH